jgi:hypothetical protein
VLELLDLPPELCGKLLLSEQSSVVHLYLLFQLVDASPLVAQRALKL